MSEYFLGDPPTDRGPIVGIPKDDLDALRARIRELEAAQDDHALMAAYQRGYLDGRPAPVAVSEALAETDRKITQDELIALFGDNMPVEVARVLMKDGGYASPLDARKAVNAALRAIAEGDEQ